MSIFFIVGKPGGGKTYLGVHQICEELKDATRQRNIVTNISLNIPALAEWVHKNCSHEVNLTERIRILDESQTAEFWKYEPHVEWNKRKRFTTGQGNRIREYDVPDFDGRGAPGTLYVIDEVHVHFGAREWQQTGTDCTWFLTQHRKLGCDVVFITQHPDQTDKALRRLAQEFMSVRNLSREPVMGFRVGNLFRYIRSLHSPTTPNWGPFESGFVRLKPDELGKLYDTTAGVGIAGRVAPRVETRGRSLWWLLVPAAIILLILFNMRTIVHYLRTKASSVVSTGIGKVMTNGIVSFKTPGKVEYGPSNVSTSALPARPITVPRQLASYDVVTIPVQTNSTLVAEKFFYTANGKSRQWFLLDSQGNTYTEERHTLQAVTPFLIRVDKKWFVRKPWASKLDNEGFLWHTNSAMGTGDKLIATETVALNTNEIVTTER